MECAHVDHDYGEEYHFIFNDKIFYISKFIHTHTWEYKGRHSGLEFRDDKVTPIPFNTIPKHILTLLPPVILAKVRICLEK